MKKTLCVTVMMGMACAASSASAAVSVDYSELAGLGSGPAPAGGSGLVTAQAFGGNFKAKTVKGVSAVGVSGGSVNAEIDNDEAIEFVFSTPVRVTDLSLAHLFTSGNYGDTVDESARMFVERPGEGAGEMFTLTATGATAGLWDGDGSLTNLSIATNAGGGMWAISGADIFGGPISSLRLGSGNPVSAGGCSRPVPCVRYLWECRPWRRRL